MHRNGRLIEPVQITLPDLPAALEGLRVAHLSDLHATRWRRRHDRIVVELAAAEVDMLVLTGDYIERPGHEPAALAMLERLCQKVRPLHGIYGVFGNHDTADLCRSLKSLPVAWLTNHTIQLEQLPLQIQGLGFLDYGVPDTLAALPGNGALSHAPRHVARLVLCHDPGLLPAVADMGGELMLSGHTHGGQFRLPRRRALVNSCELPLHLSGGVLRHMNTLCVISRGVGEANLPLRLFCPPHIPILTLRRGPLPGRHTHHIENVRPW